MNWSFNFKTSGDVNNTFIDNDYNSNNEEDAVSIMFIDKIADYLSNMFKNKKSKSNFARMFSLNDPPRYANFCKMISMILSNSFYTSKILEVVWSQIKNCNSCAVVCLIILFTSVYIFIEKFSVESVTKLIDAIKERKLFFLTKLFLFSNCVRTFFITYYSIPKPLIDDFFLDIKPYSNVKAQGVTAYDLATMCERFIIKNNVKNLEFLGVFYSNSNFNNWSLATKHRFNFGLFATGVPQKPKHWISFLLDKNTRQAYLYDSCNQYAFGHKFFQFLENSGYKFNRTYTTHQYDSNYCGLYCLLFMAVMCSDTSETNQVYKDLFADNTICMDKHMEMFEEYFYTKETEVSESTAVLMFIENLLSNIHV